MESFSSYISLPTIFGVVIAYYVWLIPYRLFLHPLARFPGPKLAAVSRWYEAYYDVIKDGQYTSKIAELHKIHGPIIRISPHELHITDSDYYDTLYRTDGRWHKYAWAYDAFGAKNATVFTPDHDAHKAYRRAIGSYFSKSNVIAREHLLMKNNDKLCDRISKKVGEDLNLGAALSAATRANANNYIIDKEYNELDQEDFGIGISHTSQGAGVFWRTTKHIPWFGPVMRAMPISWAMKTSGESTRNFLLLLQKSEQDTRDTLAAATSDSSDTKEHPTMVHAIVRSNLPPVSKKFERVFEDVFTVTAAAFETTANVIRLIFFHVYKNDDILRQLRSEIKTAFPDSSKPLSWKKLEQLPYLTAVLMEGLRLSPGISTRMARITDKDLFYENWRIPAGTPVGMTTILMHLDENLYPDPLSYIPDRWISGTGKPPGTSKWAPFSRGTRICLGLHLAWAEMYVIVAALVQRFDFEIKDAVASDFEMEKDNFGIGTRAGCDLRVHVSSCDG